MLKRIFRAILLFFLCQSFTTDDTVPDVKELRKEVIVAIEKSSVTDSLYKTLKPVNPKPPIIVGYVAMLEALKAKHAWNPYSKFSYLGKSRKTFEEAVSADPENLEIRFMRFSVQHFLPSYLGYSKNLEEDRKQIIRLLEKQNKNDRAYTKTVVRFLLDSKRCTTSEEAFLHKELKNLV
ncbi:MAG: hypothetical protein INR69_13500 [Mucilaginibacter polytrichastri]|nr:hypothetical protein [Mucilaginibacter polytrichastri]